MARENHSRPPWKTPCHRLWHPFELKLQLIHENMLHPARQQQQQPISSTATYSLWLIKKAE